MDIAIRTSRHERCIIQPFDIQTAVYKMMIKFKLSEVRLVGIP